MSASRSGPFVLAGLAALYLCFAAVPAMAQQGNLPRGDNPRAEFEKDVQLLRKEFPSVSGYPHIDFSFPGTVCTSAGMRDFTLNPLPGSSLRLRIMRLAQHLTPVPAIPEPASEEWAEGRDLLKAMQLAPTHQEAQADLEKAVQAYEEAIDQAPWYPDFYFDAGIALGGVDKQWQEYKAAGAVVMYRWYLAGAPGGPDANAAIGGIAQLKADWATTKCIRLSESKSWNPLLWAVENGETRDEVQQLLDRGADVNAADGQGYTALIWASVLNRADLVRLFLADGARTDSQGAPYYYTALDWAAVLGHLEVVQLLLGHGADVAQRDQFGGTTLILAAGAAPGLSDEVWDFLLDHRRSVIASNTEVVAGHLDVVRALLAHGADVNAKDSHGATALIMAAGWDHLGVVQLLVAHGADVNAKDSDGTTALSNAASDGYKNIVDYLRRHGAD